jgi:hypothetical protein
MGLGGARLGRSNRDDRLEVEVVGLQGAPGLASRYSASVSWVKGQGIVTICNGYFVVLTGII